MADERRMADVRNYVKGFDMRQIIWMCIVASAFAGCMQQDENPHWSPRTDLPAWTYDAPFYYRPSQELEPTETVGKDIGVYYVPSEYFYIHHPGSSQLIGTPRVGVWFSTDQGQTWEKGGYFGVEQTHFRFQAEMDGAHLIRFVGPGLGTAKGPVPAPHRVYVVDRQAPELALAISPPSYDDEEKKPHVYEVGDEVSLGWAVRDANLSPESIRLESCFGKAPYRVVWNRFRGALLPEGRRVIRIPPEAATERGFRFRIEAQDKAGNVGEAFTPVLLTVRVPEPPTTRPAPPVAEPFVEISPEPGEEVVRPGWPRAGSLLRGGTEIRLVWMPEAAKKYDNMLLQLSTNNALIWKTIVEGVTFGDEPVWTVPKINNRFCRLRLIAIGPGDEKILMARSPRFRIATAKEDVEVGPTPIPSAED